MCTSYIHSLCVPAYTQQPTYRFSTDLDKNQQSILAWLQRSWDIGAERVVVNGPYFSKMATITIHAALRQTMYVTSQHNEENHLLIQWLMSACWITWLNKKGMPTHSVLWNYMEELKNYIQEPDVRRAIYEDPLKVLTYVNSLQGWENSTASYPLSLCVTCSNLKSSEAIIQQASQLVADLGEAECRRSKHSIQSVQEKKYWPREIQILGQWESQANV